ncbi:unnamed protein product [Rodentolepis nana]|uniref:Geranylgeranyl pyrophosphate synthase n=1 Tax=Rodentolepis nana TaxID=102285 RepID=A0A158QHT3_RODNA|nr:unnamed protein product [Rodentolepis nana]
MPHTPHFDSDDIILAPFNYLTENSGKGMRTKLIKAFNLWLNIDQDKLDLLSDIIETLHNASLIVDDIEDNSDRRRNKPAAHMLFGVPLSINAANFAYFIALEKALRLNHPDVPKVYAEQMIDLHRGQGMDIYWRCSLKCPTEHEYNEMVKQKTGGLFGMAVKLMQLFSTNTSDYGPLLASLGLWFQIRDDYANLVDTSYHEAKDFADDLTEGKFSFPIVHAINGFPNDHQTMAILRQRTTNRAVKDHAIQHLDELGSLEYTACTLIRLEKEIRQMVADFGGNPYILRFLDDYCIIYRDADQWASDKGDSNKPDRRLFNIQDVSLNESSFESNVPTGLQLFSDYRKGILNPDVVSTQGASTLKESTQETTVKKTEPRIPVTWLKPRSALSRLAADHALPTSSSNTFKSDSTPVIPQKVPYDSQTTPTKSGLDLVLSTGSYSN